jgi:hypothetical protein
MTEPAGASPIVSNDHQSFMYPLVGHESDPRRDDAARVVRCPGGNGRARGHRPSAIARRGGSDSGSKRDSGRQLALFSGSTGGDHSSSDGRGRDRLDGRVDHRTGRIGGDRQPGPSGAVWGTNLLVPRFDVVRPARSWLRGRQPDRGGASRSSGRNAVCIETWPHAPLIDACTSVMLVTELHDAWIGAGLTHVTRPVRG